MKVLGVASSSSLPCKTTAYAPPIGWGSVSQTISVSVEEITWQITLFSGSKPMKTLLSRGFLSEKFSPEIVSKVPPLSDPDVGLIPVMIIL